MNLKWDSYMRMVINVDETCECHQTSGDSPDCKRHYKSMTEFRGVKFGDKYTYEDLLKQTPDDVCPCCGRVQ